MVVGQRYVSEPEPELGLGLISSVESFRVGMRFPATGEERLYAADTQVLKRVRFREGDRVSTREGVSFCVESVEEAAGLFVYSGEGQRVQEDALADATLFSQPQDRLMGGRADSGDAFHLRYRALRAQSDLRRSP